MKRFSAARNLAGEGAQGYLAAVESCSADPIIGVSVEETIAGWNAAAERAFGYKPREIKGRPVSLLFSPGHLRDLKHIVDRVRRGATLRGFQTVCIRKDGRPVPVSLNVSPVEGQNGKVTGGVLIVRDISRRLKGRETLVRQNRELLTFHRLSQIVLSPRSLLQSYRDVAREIRAATGFPIVSVAVQDPARRMIVFHGLSGRSTGRERSGRPDRRPLEFPIDKTMSGVVIRTGTPVIESHVPDHPEYRSKVLKRTHAQTFVGYPMKVGERIIGCLNLAHTESVPISDEMVRWIEGLANYVAVLTERKRSEEELRVSREQLRELSRRNRSSVEEERKRIAREIHDELGQELSLLQLELGMLQERLPAAEKNLRKKTTSMAKLIDSAIRSVQKISSDLRPTLLDNLGLGAAAEWAGSEFQKRTRIRTRISVEPRDLTLDPERSTALFRILQEALTNVLRHARASRVEVRLLRRNRQVQLHVRDNGIGIPAERIQDPRSAGLAGMRERVLPWQGTVEIVGDSGKGTQVTVSVPIPP